MAITVNDIKKMSPQAKALVIILIVFAIGYLYYFYFLADVLTRKAQIESELETIKMQIAQKEKVVLQLDQYIAEVEALEENYKVALLKLPDQREIPGLFHSVALAGKDAGVEFALFEPRAAVPRTLDRPEAAKAAPKAKKGEPEPEPEPFYEEIPVKVTVTGHFQSIVHFFEKVAKLPRIVNVSDISIGDRKDVKGRGNVLTASCTVKTYMFVDKKESVSEKTK
jgi:type IV pilus assembly protein PilO